jgi:hypothetical protein
MAEDFIRYDVLVQDALRGVVRKVLREVAESGLPGNHHFYIAFDTRAAGVRISSRLRQQYPEEMTIVLQHQFWDLNVTEHAFEAGLSFGGVPERLLVPFTAIKGFFDPSVQFGLQFEPAEGAAAGGQLVADGKPHLPAPTSDEFPVIGRRRDDAPAPVPAEPERERAGAAASSEKNKAEKDEAAETEQDKAADTADVVSLDAFRKKT